LLICRKDKDGRLKKRNIKDKNEELAISSQLSAIRRKTTSIALGN